MNYNKLSELIKKENLSMREFSAKINIPAIGETIRKQTLSVKTLEKICEYFDKPISYFFDEPKTYASVAFPLNMLNEPKEDFEQKYYRLLEKYTACLERVEVLEKKSIAKIQQ